MGIIGFLSKKLLPCVITTTRSVPWLWPPRPKAEASRKLLQGLKAPWPSRDAQKTQGVTRSLGKVIGVPNEHLC